MSRLLGRLSSHARSSLHEWLFRDENSLAAMTARGQFVLGRHSYHAGALLPWVGDHGVVRIGQFCSVAANATFMSGESHHPEWITTSPLRTVMDLRGLDYTSGLGADITVGNDVWIGRDAMVMGDVTIGDGAVVAARAVVTRDVRPYAVVAGVPATERRRRFTDEQVAALLAIRWWDWPDEKIVENAHLLCSARIDEFISAHR